MDKRGQGGRRGEGKVSSQLSLLLGMDYINMGAIINIMTFRVRRGRDYEGDPLCLFLTTTIMNGEVKVDIASSPPTSAHVVSECVGEVGGYAACK